MPMRGRHTKVSAYLEQLASHLKVGGTERRRILTEVSDHMLGRVQKEEAAGASANLAQERAISEFGDPAVVARRFSPSPATRSSGGSAIFPVSPKAKPGATRALPLRRESKTVP